MTNCPKLSKHPAKTWAFFRRLCLFDHCFYLVTLSDGYPSNSQGGENGVFGKRWFCLSDTRHFRHFRRLLGSEERNPFFLVGRMQIVIFAIFRQNHLLSVGGKNTVFQKHRFHNHETPGMPRKTRDKLREQLFQNHEMLQIKCFGLRGTRKKNTPARQLGCTPPWTCPHLSFVFC